MLYSICACIFPPQFQIAKAPRHYWLLLRDSSPTQTSQSGKVMPEFFKPTFKKKISVYYIQTGKIHAEQEACCRGKGNLGPSESKEKIGGGSLSQPPEGSHQLFLPPPTSRHSWTCLRQNHWIHSALQHCIHSEKCTSTGQPPLKTDPLFLVKASLKSVHITGCCFVS